MKEINKTEAASWLAVKKPQEGSTRVTIENVLPRFDNYFAIRWTPGVIENFPFNEIILPPTTEEQSNNNISIWTRFAKHFDNDNAYTPTTFKELALKFNLPYDLQISNHLPWVTKGLKTLWTETAKKLQLLLNSLPFNDELNVYVDDLSRFNLPDFVGKSGGIAFKISVLEFIDLMDKTLYDADLFLYPDNKEWCFVNMEDLNYWILAYNQSVSKNVKELDIPDMIRIFKDSPL